jgi:hypothetical protein
VPSPTPSRIEGNPSKSKVGEPFVFALENANAKSELTLTVTGVQCGIKGWAADGDNPAIVAPDGLRFCELAMTARNSGKVPPITTTFAGMLTTTDGFQFNFDDNATQARGDAATSKNRAHYGGNTLPDLNPGESAKTVIDWAIPIGAEPASFDIADSGVLSNIYGETRDAVVTTESSQTTWLNPKGQ